MINENTSVVQKYLDVPAASFLKMKMFVKQTRKQTYFPTILETESIKILTNVKTLKKILISVPLTPTTVTKTSIWLFSIFLMLSCLTEVVS